MKTPPFIFRVCSLNESEFDDHEYATMMLAISGQVRNRWQFAMNAEPRHGEIAALAWEDVDLDSGKVHIQRNLTAQGDFVPPKTKAGDRVIFLRVPALDALHAQYAFTGHMPHARNRDRTAFQRVRKYVSSETSLRFSAWPEN